MIKPDAKASPRSTAHDPLAESSHFGLPLCLRFHLSPNEMQQLATVFSTHQNLPMVCGLSGSRTRLNIHWEDEVVSGSSPFGHKRTEQSGPE